jgi:hypothetical protein
VQLELTARFEAVQAGHHHVHENEIGLLVRHGLEGLFATGDARHRIAFTLENRARQPDVPWNVVHDQNATCRCDRRTLSVAGSFDRLGVAHASPFRSTRGVREGKSSQRISV